MKKVSISSDSSLTTSTRAYGGEDRNFCCESSIYNSNFSEENTETTETPDSTNVQSCNETLTSVGGHSNIVLENSDSCNSYPYNCETLDMLMKTINEANSYDKDVIESENMNLRKKLLELEEEEQLEKEKLINEEKRLRMRLHSKRSEVYKIKHLKEHQEENNTSIEGSVYREMKKTEELRSKLDVQREIYEGTRSKLYDLTLELHDEIRFRTAGIKNSKDLIYNCFGVELHFPIPIWIWNIKQSPRKRRFYLSMMKNALDSLEYLLITLSMLVCLGLLLYVSGAMFLNCDLTFFVPKELVNSLDSKPAGTKADKPESSHKGGEGGDKKHGEDKKPPEEKKPTEDKKPGGDKKPPVEKKFASEKPALATERKVPTAKKFESADYFPDYSDEEEFSYEDDVNQYYERKRKNSERNEMTFNQRRKYKGQVGDN